MQFIDNYAHWICLEIALLCAQHVLSNWLIARKMKRWLKVDATITKSELGKSRSVDDAGSRFYLIVEYNYEITSTKYTGMEIDLFRESFGCEDRARESLTKYPLAATVPVYTNPNKPQRSILDPTHSFKRDWPVITISIGFFIGACVFATLL